MTIRTSRRKLLIGCFMLGAVCVSASPFVGAWGFRPSHETLIAGRQLFEHEWTPADPLAEKGDGLGPVFNAKSCVECHFQEE